jgi:NADP-dependent 3-hydroxy acid dehydrogenase YdfG
MTTSGATTGRASRVWFITGASRGLGRAFTEAALAAGDRVAGASRDISPLDDLVARHPDRLLALRLDVTDRAAVFDVVDKAVEHFGRLDVVVNNAGALFAGMVEEFTEAQARAQLDLNFFGALWVSQAVLPQLRAQGSGHIVQISSIGALGGFPSTGLYSASKFALEGMSEALAAEAVMTLVDSDDPPLRLLLGSMVYDVAFDISRQRMDTWSRWEASAAPRKKLFRPRTDRYRSPQDKQHSSCLRGHLLGDPAVLVLDEPANGLAPEGMATTPSRRGHQQRPREWSPDVSAQGERERGERGAAVAAVRPDQWLSELCALFGRQPGAVVRQADPYGRGRRGRAPRGAVQCVRGAGEGGGRRAQAEQRHGVLGHHRDQAHLLMAAECAAVP